MESSRHDTRDGVVIGLIAYAAVAAFYSAFDFLASRGTLYTVNLLGGALFEGMRDPSVLRLPVPLHIPGILGYNALHLALSLAIGVVVMHLIGHAERVPGHARLVTAVVVLGFVLTIAVVGWLSTPIRPMLPFWSIVVANTLAVALAAAYVVRRRPGVIARLLGTTAPPTAGHPTNLAT